MPIWGWRMIRAACLISALPISAAANAWDVFVDRCLMPMELAQPIATDDMTEAERTDVTQLFRTTTVAYDIEVLIPLDGGQWSPQTCSVIAKTEDSRQDLLSGFALWEREAIATGRYAYLGEPVPGVDAPPKEQLWAAGPLSVEFREPRINVRLNDISPDQPTFVAVQETFYES